MAVWVFSMYLCYDFYKDEDITQGDVILIGYYCAILGPFPILIVRHLADSIEDNEYMD